MPWRSYDVTLVLPASCFLKKVGDSTHISLPIKNSKAHPQIRSGAEKNKHFHANFMELNHKYECVLKIKTWVCGQIRSGATIQCPHLRMYFNDTWSLTTGIYFTNMDRLESQHG